MKDIENREDISQLVNAFYTKIREDELLGPIFNAHIAPEAWPGHLEKLTDFWETNLFGVPKFKGNPSLKHVNVDKNLNYSVEQLHFGRWLQLWFATVNELFSGDLAIRARESARKMASGQFMMIWNHRPEMIQNK